jgi:hypothetical protein
MKLGYLALSAVFCSAFFTAAPAMAADASPAVNVTGCATNGAQPQQQWTSVFGGNVYTPAVPSVLMIDFENVSSKPIKAVEFGLVKNGKVVTMVRDAGTFVPNALVMHAFGSDIDLGTDTNATCVPLRIEYADGTAWMPPAMPDHR